MGLQLQLRRQSGWLRRWCVSEGCLPLQGSIPGQGLRAVVQRVDMPARCAVAFVQLCSSFVRCAKLAIELSSLVMIAAQD